MSAGNYASCLLTLAGPIIVQLHVTETELRSIALIVAATCLEKNTMENDLSPRSRAGSSFMRQNELASPKLSSKYMVPIASEISLIDRIQSGLVQLTFLLRE
ncbi:hypothetical protein Ciccas_000592 [Cichlidogyrus casuarinus]|uniref:Uncharacterized protein n=1 Tax=Cichlidogyrus casuarinus TaxID=1844966 RepID=A0ABD2QMG3_9PLAT